MTRDEELAIHPGAYIKDKVLPAGLSVKEAAKLLGVGRPALSNLLNENAALSQDMAARIEKAFGASKEMLLRLQAEFEESTMRQRQRDIAVGAYVPTFLKITARNIETWADGNLGARSLLAVLLRQLVHSTGRDLSLVNFPGYDNAERKGWDGQIDADAATPWIPSGKSGWEFGCNKKPRQKAESDYANRVRSISADERTALTFVFVTPRAWDGKDEWAKRKESQGEWKSVRAYDSSDLEQWIEQSIPAQAWFAEQIGIPREGVYSLDEQWGRWASVTVPELPKSLFEPSVTNHKGTLKKWLEGEQATPLIVGADSKDEALAFLCCLFDAEEFAKKGYRDRAIVFSSASALRKLASSSSHFIAIIATDEVERELASVSSKTAAIIVRPRNSVETKPDIVIGLPRHKAFQNALATVGITGDRVDTLARESGYSPTILRRRLAKIPALRVPAWAQDAKATRILVPMMLVGAWHRQSKADREILSLLAHCPYSEIEQRIADALIFDDPPVWSVGQYRGMSSKIDALFAVQGAVTQEDLDDFFVVAELVLSKRDPALDLSEDKRWAAGLYGKTREHSGALREGICETLVILAVHGNNLFRKRLGVDVRHRIDDLIERLLTPLTLEMLLSLDSSLPLFAEAAPDQFLRIFEDDLRTSEPQVYALLTPADSGIPGTWPRRTGLLWALETLAWTPERLVRVCSVLAQLAERKIDDNWANKPDGSLISIFRSWMPQTAAPLDERKKALEILAEHYPDQAWKVCREEFVAGLGRGHYNARPRWRTDASGAGELASKRERYEFTRKALDLALAWPNHNEETLGDLVESLQDLPQEDQIKVWDLIDAWANREDDQDCKSRLRERIRRFALTRKCKPSANNTEARDRACEAYERLTPEHVVVRHHWLFSADWVQESYDELKDENSDWLKREERIRSLRIAALREIWEERGFEGIQALLANSGAAWTIGRHLPEEVLDSSEITTFITECLGLDDTAMGAKNDELIGGMMHALTVEARAETTGSLLTVLTSERIVRLLRLSPFERDTWLYLDGLAPETRVDYWREVHPGRMRNDTDVNEAIDHLLAVQRPRAAFLTAQFVFDDVETSRLKRLLDETATCSSEPDGTYQIDAHYVSSALDVLEKRAGVTEDEKARLEFLFLQALDHSKHGIPNLERQLAKAPSLFVQLLALSYKRDDGGEDPPEWGANDREAVWSAAYTLLERMKHTPGADETGRIDSEKLKLWIKELRALCLTYGRVAIGDQHIGKLMSAVPVGDDGVWPCEAVRKVLEEIGSPDIATGMRHGVYNSRGAHWRGEGGDQERELAAKYGGWARKLSEYPYLSRTLEQIANGYEREAVYEDSEAAVERRLRR